MVVSPTQYTLWEWGLKRLLNQLLVDSLGNQALAALTTDYFASEGAHKQPEDQPANLLRKALDDIKNAARKALMQVPNGNMPTLDFVEIKQGPNEPYIDHQRQALERQVTHKWARD